MGLNKLIFLFLLLTTRTVESFCQPETSDSSFIKISAGPQYKKPRLYQWLWGTNRRPEWTTPVRVPKLLLDSAYGGLIPYKAGGGNESKTLRLKTSAGKEYALHSINKSRKDVVLPIYKHTFIEDIINDGVCMSYPYGAFCVPVMEESAGIYHTNPQLVYLPQQDALDTFNKKFANDLYLLEQRPEGDWSDADNLGNFKNFTATQDLIDKLLSDNKNKVDQFAFVKARLFDMLIGDWDRHEDNWQWGSMDTVAATYYPIPRDRDQAFYTHHGFLIDRMIPASGLGFMQNFDAKMPDVKILNYEERNMDRFFTNEMSLDDWTRAARILQQTLTDTVIEESIQQLAPEIFAISGKELIDKLKARRNDLVEYATGYYLFLSKEVEVTSSKQREYFYVDGSSSGETLVKIFRINNAGNKEESAFYSRTFKSSETKEIRLYGIDGKDVYIINGSSGIHVCIIGGPSKDSVVEISESKKTDIYDNPENVFQVKQTSLHIKKDSTLPVFTYENHEYNKSGIAPTLFYDYDDRVYVGLEYSATTYSWRRKPFAAKQKASLHYSFEQKAINATYNAIFPNVINNWNVSFVANYDAIKWKNFFGLGNETDLTTSNENYFRMRTRELLFNPGVNKNFGKNNLSISAFFRSVKILNDTENYFSKIFLPLNRDALESNNYTGAQLSYTYLNIDDSIVPTKGIAISGTAVYTFNISRGEFFQNYSGSLQAYIPLFDKFSLAMRSGSATIIGNTEIINSAEFYEHAVIGGPMNLRGFMRERFWGKTSFYNNNELRYITNLRTHLVNAKAGILVFFDDGRVWIPQENSNTMHISYGGGLIIAPFNMISATVTYGISEESKLFQLNINKIF